MLFAYRTLVLEFPPATKGGGCMLRASSIFECPANNNTTGSSSTLSKKEAHYTSRTMKGERSAIYTAMRKRMSARDANPSGGTNMSDFEEYARTYRTRSGRKIHKNREVQMFCVLVETASNADDEWKLPGWPLLRALALPRRGVVLGQGWTTQW
ncbi:hypothetical protein K474DRAFT_1674769 [Panus rudis PR-1116 ss-1]|nr:hypothetical protein K474DRAFT_1674769 [Panus rudis PR-1116 ss-1]